MTAYSLNSPSTRFSRPVAASIRRERSSWRAEFSPVKTRMLQNAVCSLGYTWLSASGTRDRASGRSLS